MILGLTGGIATGKSTATNFFKEKGYSVICADTIAREITEKSEILDKIAKEFGNDVISEGKLNRKILREKVFIDKNKVKLLNEITHPAIIEEIKLEINKNAEESLVILDIPLLFEGNYEFLVDKSLLIFCDEDIQIERIKERDRVDAQNAINIIKNQLSLLEKKQRADYIIENNEGKEEFYKKLNSFLDKINDLNK